MRTWNETRKLWPSPCYLRIYVNGISKMSTVMEKVSSGITVKAQPENCKISFSFLSIPFTVSKTIFTLKQEHEKFSYSMPPSALSQQNSFFILQGLFKWSSSATIARRWVETLHFGSLWQVPVLSEYFLLCYTRMCKYFTTNYSVLCSGTWKK